MRVLVVGAGAIGGYFGGRLLQAGRDVTFLVRPKRAGELATAGLVIKSPLGDVTLKNPPTVQADKLTEKFDGVLLSCKAFDLEDAIKSFAPAVNASSCVRNVSLAERKMMGSLLVSELPRSRRHSSIPSRLGIAKSVMTRSGRHRSSSSASSPGSTRLRNRTRRRSTRPSTKSRSQQVD